uniref:Golgi apparatus membrane protein TVP23 n=1 Tax=Populus davidiana TaxID=266767 RepID=A0A6M2F1G0_9ROSI
MRQGESVWKFECLDQQPSARMNKKDSLLFWWTLYLNAAAWVILGIFSVLRYEADYVLVVAVCASLSIANIVGFTKCRKGLDILNFLCQQYPSFMPRSKNVANRLKVVIFF